MKDLDNQETLHQHKEIISQKYFLRNIYVDFYRHFKKIKYPTGKLIELGSGAGFIKKVIPHTITSDVVKGQGIDKVFFAEKIPFKDSSVAGFVMIDVLHHIKKPQLALKEMERCLKMNGKVIMIEPYNSLWGRFIYQNFHHEEFNPNGGWTIKGSGRLTDANGALPWIIFVRDRKKYDKLFPELKVRNIEVHTPFRYLLSGGLSKPQLLPNNFYSIIKSVEHFLRFLNPHIGMFVTIELEKVTHKPK